MENPIITVGTLTAGVGAIVMATIAFWKILPKIRVRTEIIKDNSPFSLNRGSGIQVWVTNFGEAKVKLEYPYFYAHYKDRCWKRKREHKFSNKNKPDRQDRLPSGNMLRPSEEFWYFVGAEEILEQMKDSKYIYIGVLCGRKNKPRYTKLKIAGEFN